jgi:hypothetical protein
MAQSNKSRIIIWSIVGVLAVIAVIMLITRPKNLATGPTINVANFVEDKAGVLDRLEKRAVRQGVDAGTAEQIAAEVAKARAVLEEMKGMTDAPQVDLRKKVDEFQDAHLAAKKLLKQAGGKDEGGE